MTHPICNRCYKPDIEGFGGYQKQIYSCMIYVFTTGPWTATPVLINMNKKNQPTFQREKQSKSCAIFWGMAHRVYTVVKTATKRPPSLATPQLDETTYHIGTHITSSSLK